MLVSKGRLGERDVDVRIENGRIVEIGSIGRGDIELDGRWIVPGLWDEHVHFTQWVLTSRRLDLSAAQSAADAAAAVTAAVESSAAAGDLLVGAGFRDGLWPDRPTRELLDRAAGDTAVALVSADLHSAWINSAAAGRFGMPVDAAGLLREGPAFAVAAHVASVDESTLDAWARDAAIAAASRGVVGIADLEMAWNRGAWERRIAGGHDALRVQAAIYREDLDRAVDEGLSTGLELHPLLTVGGFKVLTDGSLGTRTAFVADPYADGGTGMLTVPPEELLPLMRRASDAGIVPWVHAIGDAANSLALDAFAELGVVGRIEHAQLLARSDVPRFAALGVEASVQPQHLIDDRDLAESVWPWRTDRLYAFRSLLDAGARLRFGSDAPVSPLDPWLAMAAAVTRTGDEREPWHPEQRVGPAEALAASTRSTIEAGQVADLVAVERDPLEPSGSGLRGMPVALTLLGGRVTHQAL